MSSCALHPYIQLPTKVRASGSQGHTKLHRTQNEPVISFILSPHPKRLSILLVLFILANEATTHSCYFMFGPKPFCLVLDSVGALALFARCQPSSLINSTFQPWVLPLETSLPFSGPFFGIWRCSSNSLFLQGFPLTGRNTFNKEPQLCVLGQTGLLLIIFIERRIWV